MRLGWLLVMWALSGCDSLRLNPGRLAVIAAAAHAGQFQRETGRWPTSREQLETFPCPNLDGGENPAPYSPRFACRFFVALPYEVDMQPRGAALRMEFRDRARHRVCTLRVVAPRVPAGSDIAPMSIIRTGLFSCPGAAEEKP